MAAGYGYPTILHLRPCVSVVLSVTLSESWVSWVRILHKAAPETVCVHCIISGIPVPSSHSKLLIIQRHTVSGSALWGIHTLLPLKVIGNFERELGTDAPQGCT